MYIFFSLPSLPHPLDLCLLPEDQLLLLGQPLDRDLHHAHACDHLLFLLRKTSALFECLIPTELLPRPASLCIPCGSCWWAAGWVAQDDDGWKGLEIVRSGRPPQCDERWRNIYIRGGRSERLTADNQLVRQSDSEEMIESIKIFQTTGTPSCQSENIRLVSEYRAVSWRTLTGDTTL